MQINQEVFDRFCYWIREREAIRLRKECGAPRPWTSDPIMGAHHFCNVRREHDRGTKELRAAWKADGIWNQWRHHKEWPAQWTAARMLNYAPSFLTVCSLWTQPSTWASMLKHIQEHGEKVFHTAYVVSTCGKSMNKVDYVLQVVAAVRAKGISTLSCRQAFEDLRSIDGLGSFMAGQVVADLKNIGYLANTMVDDWWTFSVPGPGSLKGLGFLYGMKATERMYPELMEDLTARLPPDIVAMRIHQQDLQNCLCEFSKYMRYLQELPGRVRYYP